MYGCNIYIWVQYIWCNGCGSNTWCNKIIRKKSTLFDSNTWCNKLIRHSNCEGNISFSLSKILLHKNATKVTQLSKAIGELLPIYSCSRGWWKGETVEYLCIDWVVEPHSHELPYTLQGGKSMLDYWKQNTFLSGPTWLNSVNNILSYGHLKIFFNLNRLQYRGAH